MKALLAYSIPRKIDYCTLYQYLQLNYVPAPWSMIEGVRKLQPGSWMKLNGTTIEKGSYYQMPKTENPQRFTYADAQNELMRLLDASVERRLISDVPLGSFLSGGVDSSIIATIAKQKLTNLLTVLQER